jgi:hypothetical protein
MPSNFFFPLRFLHDHKPLLKIFTPLIESTLPYCSPHYRFPTLGLAGNSFDLDRNPNASARKRATPTHCLITHTRTRHERKRERAN